jgi:hypothetical protein
VRVGHRNIKLLVFGLRMPDGGRSKGDRAYRRVPVLMSALAARNAVAAARPSVSRAQR